MPRVDDAKGRNAVSEVFPLVAGVAIALLVPRLVAADRRAVASGGLAVLTAATATVVAGEAWFFVFVDLAEVLVAIGVTLALAAARSGRRTTRRPSDATFGGR